ncbi:MAG: FAD-dependent oxidoreductase [Acidobacteriota bacterium]
MSQVDVDVLVVGAGLSGLAAARALSLEGASVLVLEAQPRVGGRLYSPEVRGRRVELGAHFVSSGQQRLAALCQDIGVPLAPTPSGLHVFELGGRLSRQPKLEWPLSVAARAELKMLDRRLNREAARRAIGELAVPEGQSFARMGRGLQTRGARSLFRMAVRLSAGVEPEELSLAAGVRLFSSSEGLLPRILPRRGAFSGSFEGGSQRLCERLALRLGDAVRVQSPVSTVEHRFEGFDVHTSQGDSWSSKVVILAVPPPLLAGIDFVPSLGGPVQEAIQRLPMGAIGIFAAVYDTPWWRPAGLSGQAFSDQGFLQLVFDGSPDEGGEGVLVGTVSGAKARSFFSLSPEDRQLHAQQELSELFGARAFDAVGFVDRDWRADPWARGGPTVAMAPATSHLGSAFAFDQTGLLWAGSEVTDEWVGTLEGAIASGESAAAAALDRLAD